MTMKELAAEYQKMADRSQYLWKGAYTDISRVILKHTSRKRAAAELLACADRFGTMAVSGAYRGAAEALLDND